LGSLRKIRDSRKRKRHCKRRNMKRPDSPILLGRVNHDSSNCFSRDFSLAARSLYCCSTTSKRPRGERKLFFHGNSTSAKASLQVRTALGKMLSVAFARLGRVAK